MKRIGFGIAAIAMLSRLWLHPGHLRADAQDANRHLHFI